MYVIKDNLAVNLEITQTIEVKAFEGLDNSTGRIIYVWVIEFDSSTKFGFDSEDEATSVLADILQEYESGQTRVMLIQPSKKEGGSQNLNNAG